MLMLFHTHPPSITWPVFIMTVCIDLHITDHSMMIMIMMIALPMTMTIIMMVAVLQMMVKMTPLEPVLRNGAYFHGFAPPKLGFSMKMHQKDAG